MDAGAPDAHLRYDKNGGGNNVAGISRLSGKGQTIPAHVLCNVSVAESVMRVFDLCSRLQIMFGVFPAAASPAINKTLNQI